MLNKFLKSGTSKDFPYYLNNRLITANYLQFILIPIAFGYSIFTYFLFPDITYIPALGVVVLLVAALLNKLGMPVFYRVLLSLMPVLLVHGYHIYLVPAGGEPIPSTMILTMAFALLPFLLFDLREKGPLFVLLSFNFLSMVLIPLAFGWLETEVDTSLFRTGGMYYVTVLTAIVLACAGLYTLSWINLRSESKSSELIAKAKEAAEAMVIKEQALQQNLEKLQAAQEDEQQRRWASEGFSTFGSLLRQQQDQDAPYDKLLAGLIKYLNVNQGGLYLLEKLDGRMVLQLKACFAYGRKKFLEKEIEPGQGLVGQCYLEKDAIYLKEIPQRYTYITSGLGEATPNTLLLVPLLYNDKVEGVLELASFKEIPAYQLDFLMKLGEDIAASVNINQVNSLTRKLLEEAQQQAEEMRAQEEEMRQNMEELSATQEEMQRKEKAYMEQIGELEAEIEGLKEVEYKI